VHDVDRTGKLEEHLLGVEQLQLAAVAGGHLEDRDARLGALAHSSRTSKRSPTSSHRKTGPSRQMNFGPSWQCPHSFTPHCMCRSSETWTRSGGTPASRSPLAAYHIMISGPQMKAVVRSGSSSALGNSVVTTPSSYFQSASAWSTVRCSSTPIRRIWATHFSSSSL